ncbi:MAG TPA: AGE family epimerase/isomerase [Chitinophagaceae bacterium]|nr:AGE family epimerase/isomerase [Chitinophagaceae bacterium]
MIVAENIISHQSVGEIGEELSSILEYWTEHTIDTRYGGFLGKIDNDNLADSEAPKGVVLNSRILWTFSAAYNREKKQSYLDMAARAYRFIVNHFIDRKYGGVYWSVDHKGEMLNGRKQIYGLAFCLYGLTEYYKATREDMALHLSENLFDQIEKNSFDKYHGGYLEAFTQGWKPVDDLRLSEKDDNEKKTMNTHLHIIEAYANLYTVSPDEKIAKCIRQLLDVFEQRFFDPKTSHLHLFMDERWNSKSSLISYGHDIEAAWLLLACAETIGDGYYIERFKDISIHLADAAAEGLDSDGGLWYEYDPASNELTREKHSWPQAEALVGFLNAWQLTGNEKYLHYFNGIWEFIKQFIKDHRNGEWFWGVYGDHSVMQKEKAGFWKCPYHNSRACMEVLKRTGA